MQDVERREHGEYDIRLARIEEKLGDEEKGLIRDIKEIKDILSQARGILAIVKLGGWLLGIGASLALIYGAFIKKTH